MKLLPRTRKTSWICALAIWLPLGIFCWQGSPYRVVREWPKTVGKDLIGFLPGEDAILTMYHPLWLGWPPLDDKTRRLNRLDLKTGEVKELLRIDTNVVCSPVVGNGGWVSFYCYGDQTNRVVLYDLKAARQVEFQVPGGTTLPMFTASPSSRFLGFRDCDEGLWVLDLSGETPRLLDKVKDSDSLIAYYEYGFGIDDLGRVTATRGKGRENPEHSEISRYEGVGGGWKTIRELQQNELIDRIVRDWSGELVVIVKNSEDQTQKFMNPETGLLRDEGDVRIVPRLQSVVEDDWLRSWVSDRFPRLNIATLLARVEYYTDSQKSYILSSSYELWYPEYFEPLVGDKAHPYLVAADQNSIRVWDCPPRKSIPSFLMSLFACGLMIAIIASVRDWRIRKNSVLTREEN